MTILEQSPDRLVVEHVPWRHRLIAALLGAACVAVAVIDYTFDGRGWTLPAIIVFLWCGAGRAVRPVVVLTLDRPANRVRVVRRSLFGKQSWKTPLENLLRVALVADVANDPDPTDVGSILYGAPTGSLLPRASHGGLRPPRDDPGSRGRFSAKFGLAMEFNDLTTRMVFDGLADPDRAAMIMAAVQAFAGLSSDE